MEWRLSRIMLALSLAIVLIMVGADHPAALSASLTSPEHEVRGTIGVVLPLSGKWESVGQRVLRGIEMAGGVFRPGPTPNVEYVIRDYGSDEDSIPSIIKDLDENHRVAAIIGMVGVGERASDAACRELQKRRIPAFIYPQAEMPPRDGTYCFRNFLTIEIQVKSLLNAARSMGIREFSVMSPDDRFGRLFTEKFQRLAPAYGISIVRTSVYSSQNVDFKRQVGSLYAASRKKAPTPGRPMETEGLLIPDTASNAAMIASYIYLLKIRNVRLFGPILWDNPDFLKAGGRYVEDAVFLSGYYQGSILSAVQDFNRSFTGTFKYPPSLWEASAYDSASILQDFLQSRQADRESLKNYLGSLKNYHGVSGTTSFSFDGTVEKVIYLLTIKDGLIYEIHP
jgi:ABC-type branched-subunit amino acid transport system substrate-binding protein